MRNLTLALLALLLLLVACTPDDPAALPVGDIAPAPQTGDDGETVVSQPYADAPPSVSGDRPLTADSAPAQTPPDAGIIRADDYIKGADDPAILLVEYGDFQCPACAAFHPIMSQLVAQYPDDVALIFRHFPLRDIHPNAQLASEAAEAAGAQGEFWQYHDLLYERQQQWNTLKSEEARVYFVELADEIGLDSTRFSTELSSGVHADKVNLTYEEAVGLGLPGTPTVIVDGLVASGNNLPFELAAWEAYIEQTLQLKQLTDRQYAAPPPMTIDEDGQYRATVTMESGDSFVIELYPKSAPQTVNSFIFLANEGWFNGAPFHRVLPDFVAQTGDPSGTGRGGPGYTLPNEVDPALSHSEPGIVAMANAGPDTGGSQWYITLGDASYLDGGYTIFGRVVEGFEVVQQITNRNPSDPNAPEGDRIQSVTISEEG